MSNVKDPIAIRLLKAFGIDTSSGKIANVKVEVERDMISINVNHVVYGDNETLIVGKDLLGKDCVMWEERRYMFGDREVSKAEAERLIGGSSE